MDIDMEDDEEYDESAYTRLGATDVLFDARRERSPAAAAPPRPVNAPPPEEDEDMWANVS